MSEDYVIFSTSELAKEKGFNEPCRRAYYNKQLLWINPFEGKGVLSKEHWFTNYENGKTFDNYHTIPTQSFLQKWLREKYNIHIEVFLQTNISGKKWFRAKVIQFTKGYNSITLNRHKFYKESLEEALQKALKLIKN